MNMISLPRPTCPYCDATMRRWPLGQAVLACDTCRRPIVRYLAQNHPEFLTEFQTITEIPPAEAAMAE